MSTLLQWPSWHGFWRVYEYVCDDVDQYARSNDHFAKFAPGMKSIDDALELLGHLEAAALAHRTLRDEFPLIETTDLRPSGA